MCFNACAFTGHRPSKLPWGYDEASPQFLAFRATMETQITALTERGTANFLSGMAEGADLVCAEIVLSLRQKNPAIKLHCILPFVGQANKWSAFSRERYQAALSQADSVIYVSRSYNRNCYLDRNRFLVDYSSVLLAVYNGSTRSGTGMTVRYARKLGREIFVIDPASLQVAHEKQGAPV